MGIAIEKGEIQCDAPGQNASYDSIVLCILFQLPFKLELIGFGYICLALLIPIILISIFGKIKEQYRWFILNQAIWDLLITYDFICEKPTYWYFKTQYGMDTFFYGPSNCVFGNKDDRGFLYFATKNVINHISYLPLFLLTLSRFICLFYNPFYQRHSSTIKILCFIVTLNLVFLILINAKPIYDIFVDFGKINLESWERHQKCSTSNCIWNLETMIPSCNQTLIDECLAKIPVSVFFVLIQI
uniref:Uncharacterized protein n=1 Tax=Panagrolaimus sp. PS1159 TaxID=55785 RepID=A0AC35FE21_9BILA